jgi:hypothetical protein
VAEALFKVFPAIHERFSPHRAPKAGEAS